MDRNRNGAFLGVTIEVVNLAGDYRQNRDYEPPMNTEEQGQNTNTDQQNMNGIMPNQLIISGIPNGVQVQIEQRKTDPSQAFEFQRPKSTRGFLDKQETQGKQTSTASLLDVSEDSSFQECDLNFSGQVRKLDQSRIAKELFVWLPKRFRIELKKEVTPMTIVTCLVYDFIIFIILSINLIFHDESVLPRTEFTLIFSCLIFGFLFDLLGRKQIFTMRVCVTSIATILVPFMKLVPIPIVHIFPIQSLALVMSSVSLTVPFIPDFIKFEKRGLAYSYTGLLLALAMVGMYLLMDLEVHKNFDIKWFFVISGCCGIVVAMTFCRYFTDNYKESRIKKRPVPILKRFKRIARSLKRSFQHDKGSILIQLSSFNIMYVIFSFFFIGQKDDQTPEKQKIILNIVVGSALVPALFYSGMKADKKPPWRMLIREYAALLFFLLVFAIREGYSRHQDFLKLFGYAGCLFIIFTIYMTNMIILSKTVRRECRGAMYGICSACGAFGALLGLTVGKYVHDMTGFESIYIVEMSISLLTIIAIFVSKIYKDRQFERPTRFRNQRKKLMARANRCDPNINEEFLHVK